MHGGATSSNQFNLDGASINAGTGEWKFAPLVDGIEEFKVSARPPPTRRSDSPAAASST